MFRHILLTATVFGFFQIQLFGQDNSVGINTTTPNKNAVLDLVSKNKNQGLLVPRISTANRNAMSLGAVDLGLIVFDTDFNLFYHWHTVGWKAGLGVLSETVATGDVEGTFPNITLKEGIVGGFQLENIRTAGTFGTGSTVVVISLDENGRVSDIVEMPISITSANIASLSILNEDLANGTITISKLNAEGKRSQVLTLDTNGNPLWVDVANFTSSTLAKNQLFVGDDNAKSVGLPVGGDVSLTNDGSQADIQIKPLTIGSAELIDDGVTKDKVNADIAGLGLSQKTDGSLAVNVGNGLSVVNDTLETNLSQVAGNGLMMSNGQLALDVDELASISQVADNDLLILNDTDGEIVGKITRKALIESSPIMNINVDGGAIDGSIIGANSSSSATFTDVTITGNTVLASGAIQTSEIEDGAIVAAKIADSNVTSTKILNETILAEDLATGAVTSNEILDETIASSDIGNLQITNAKIATRAVTFDKIDGGVFTNSLLATNAGAIASWFTPGTNQVVVTSTGGALTTKPLSSFSTNDLALGSIFVGDADNIAKALPASGSRQILIGNGTNLSSVLLNGDIDIVNSNGLVEIKNNAVQGDDIDVSSADFTVAGANVIRFNNAGGLDVTGIVNLSASTLSTNVRGFLNVDRATDLNSTLNVDGATTLNNNVTIADGATTNINSNITNIGNATSDAIDLTGATNINGGNLTVSSPVTSFSGASLTVDNTTTTINSGTINLGTDATDDINLKGEIQGANPIILEGTTDDTFETTIAVVNPTADNTISLPNASGTVVLSSGATLNNDLALTTDNTGRIVNADDSQVFNVNSDDINIGNAAGDDIDFQGQVDFAGNVNANSGLNVTGAALTTDQAVTQTGTGQVTFGGNVDATNGLDVTGNISVTGTVDDRDLALDGSNQDKLQLLSGVPAGDGTLGAFTGDIISDDTSIKNATQELETDLDALQTLSGVSDAATTLGSFSGFVISDNSTIKVAIQEIETEVEDNFTTLNSKSNADSTTIWNKVKLDSTNTWTKVKTTRHSLTIRLQKIPSQTPTVCTLKVHLMRTVPISKGSFLLIV